jgi:hypothetical protein
MRHTGNAHSRHNQSIQSKSSKHQTFTRISIKNIDIHQPVNHPINKGISLQSQRTGTGSLPPIDTMDAATASHAVASPAVEQPADSDDTKLSDVTAANANTITDAGNKGTTGKKSTVAGTLNKEQIRELRAVLERTEGDFETRSVALRDLYSTSAKGSNELERKLQKAEKKVCA